MNKTTVIVLGAVALLAGVLLGLAPMSADGTSCGSVFSANREAETEDFRRILSGRDSSGLRAGCESKRSGRKPWVGVLLVGGLVTVFAGAMLGAAERAREQDGRSAE